MAVISETNTARVIDAVVTCAGRWGISKTTVDDVAREAGLSRATVYRLFPGGKPEMVAQATRAEIVTLLADVRAEIADAATLEDALVAMLSGGTAALIHHPALAYMRQHQPTSIRTFLSFDRLDSLFVAAADVLAPSLERFLTPDASHDTVIWIARIVVSHFLMPDSSNPLEVRSVATHVARSYVMPGLEALAAQNSTGSSN